MRDHSVCMTGSGILVMSVGSSGGGWECMTTGHFGPHSCASSSLVWVQRHGPSRRLTFTAGPLCDKTTAGSHPRRGENDNPWDDCPLRSPVKMEHFFFCSTSDGAVIVPRPGSGRQGGGEHVIFMSMIRSGPAPLSHGAASDCCCHLLDSRLDILNTNQK